MQETKEWLKKAESDIAAAKYNIQGGYYEVAAFLCQQAAEKALKAVYIKMAGKLVKVHDLHFLGMQLKVPAEILEACDGLSGFYVESRYPTGYAEFKKDKISSAVQKAEKVVEWAKGKI